MSKSHYLFLVAITAWTTFGLATTASAQSTNILSTPTTTSSVVATTSEPANVAATAPYRYRIEQLPGEEVYDDFVLSPGKFEVEVQPGQSKTFNLTVANRLGKDRKFIIEIEDGGVSDDPERPIVLLGSAIGPYSIKDYVSVPAMEFFLPHARRAVIPVTISAPPNAEPGGYYGSVLIKTTTQEAVDGSAPGTVPSSAIVSRIGALLFISVPGDVERSGQLQSFTTVNDSQWFTKGPIEFAVTYENTGSVYLNPYGEIRITNFFGDEVGFVELDPWFVLPGAERLRTITWNRDVLFGRYTASMALNRGYENTIDEAVVTFWVIPWQYVVGGFVGIFILILLIRLFMRTFEFKRR